MRLVIRKIAVSFFILLVGMVVIGQNGNGSIKLKKPKRTCDSFARASLKPLEPELERLDKFRDPRGLQAKATRLQERETGTQFVIG
jgi:hypothetical protein